MPTSNVKSIYPAGIFPWTDRVDNQSVDFSNDINSTVAEVESIQKTLGTMPQVEDNLPVGNAITYNTVDDRISDAMTNAQLPYCSLTLSTLVIEYSAGKLIPYKINLDPYNMYNGTDITIPVNGWWLITAVTTYTWADTGYSHQMLTFNGSSNVIDETLVNWEFGGNTFSFPGVFPPGVIQQLPKWQVLGQRPLKGTNVFQGPLHKGDRLSVYIENGTANPQHVVNNLELKAIMLRTIPSNVNFVSG